MCWTHDMSSPFQSIIDLKHWYCDTILMNSKLWETNRKWKKIYDHNKTQYKVIFDKWILVLTVTLCCHKFIHSFIRWRYDTIKKEMRKKAVVHLTWCVFFAIIQYSLRKCLYLFFSFRNKHVCIMYMLLHKYELFFAVNFIKKAVRYRLTRLDIYILQSI